MPSKKHLIAPAHSLPGRWGSGGAGMVPRETSVSFDKQLGTSTGALGAPQLRVCVCVCVCPESTTPGCGPFISLAPSCSPFLQRTRSESTSGSKQNFKQNRTLRAPRLPGQEESDSAARKRSVNSGKKGPTGGTQGEQGWGGQSEIPGPGKEEVSTH